MTTIKIKITDSKERQDAIMILVGLGKKVWIENEYEICYEDESTVIKYIPYYEPPTTYPIWPYPIITYKYTTSDHTSSGK